VPPSTKWRSMSVRTDIVWTETTGAVCEITRCRGPAGARAASKRSPFICERAPVYTISCFVFALILRVYYIMFSRSRRSRSRYYIIIIIFLSAAASSIQILLLYMHTAASGCNNNIIMYRILICVYAAAAAAEVSVFILFASFVIIIIIIFSPHIITL